MYYCGYHNGANVHVSCRAEEWQAARINAFLFTMEQGYESCPLWRGARLQLRPLHITSLFPVHHPHLVTSCQL